MFTCSSNSYSKMISTRDKAQMIVAGGGGVFPDVTETAPCQPCCWDAAYPCPVYPSLHPYTFPYSLSPILATHYSLVPALYGGQGDKDK